jgi:hypothetical protein
MIIENPLIAIFRHYDEWSRKNQEQKEGDGKNVKCQSRKFKQNKTISNFKVQ